MSGSAILTNNGLFKIASASPLDQLTITQIAVGDGVNPLDPTATGLVNEVFRDTASTPIRSTTYPDTLIFELNIPPTTGGFTTREIGAFDSDGDMIAVGTLDEVVKPNDGINLTVRINVKLQNSEQVDVFYDNSGAISLGGLVDRRADLILNDNGGDVQEYIDTKNSLSLKNIAPKISLTAYGTKVITTSFYDDKSYGGIEYTLESEPASKHMTVGSSKVFIAIGAIEDWDGTHADLDTLLNWTPDASTGCLSFEIGEADLTHFGGVKDDISKDNIIAAQKSADVLGYVIIPSSKTSMYISQPIDVTGKFTFNIKAKTILSGVFNSADDYSEQQYLSKIFAPNGFLHNIYNSSTNLDRCREYIDGLMIYGDRSVGSVALKGRAANNINNSLIINYEKIIENDFGFLEKIENSRFDRTDWFAHISTANGFKIENCWFGSGIVRGIDMAGLTLGVGAVSTGYPMSVVGSNINCGENTEFIARTRGGFKFDDNYIECFSDTAGDSLFYGWLGRFDDGYYVIENCEINAQNHTAHLVKFFGDNAAGTQNAKARISAENRILGFTSPTPVVVGYIDPLFPSASNNVSRVTVDYPMGVDRSGNFSNYDGRISCADGTETNFSGTSFNNLPLTAISPTGTDAITSNTITKNIGGSFRCKAEVQVKTATTLRNMEIGIFVNGSKVAGVITSIVIDSAVSGDYYEVVIVEANPLTLSRSDDIQVKGRNGGIATLTKFWMEKI